MKPRETPPASVATPHTQERLKRWLLFGSLAIIALGGVGVGGIALVAAWMSGPTPVDILQLIDPEHDAVIGPEFDDVDSRWKFDGQTLVSPDASLAKLWLPCPPPEQYKLQIQADHVYGGGLVTGLVWQGRQIPVEVNKIVVGGSTDDGNGGILLDQIPEQFEWDQQPGTYTCIVRESGILVAYEDQVRFLHLSGDEPLVIDAKWQPSDGGAVRLFVATQAGVYRFTKIRLTPIRR